MVTVLRIEIILCDGHVNDVWHQPATLGHPFCVCATSGLTLSYSTLSVQTRMIFRTANYDFFNVVVVVDV
jgi:hypothetical protein